MHYYPYPMGEVQTMDVEVVKCHYHIEKMKYYEYKCHKYAHRKKYYKRYYKRYCYHRKMYEYYQKKGYSMPYGYGPIVPAPPVQGAQAMAPQAYPAAKGKCRESSSC
ncbi:hypothetical protein [Aneurinibacillus sp. UBA3580]|uniref:hypothetical protein n=1 Tax=Aneurinibacillus sp. UBA3580 TaxID=1946041 RepID=UPI002579AA11|nr:hypothetical protein [Aneurinibacillus sp. UBA3580]